MSWLLQRNKHTCSTSAKSEICSFNKLSPKSQSSVYLTRFLSQHYIVFYYLSFILLHSWTFNFSFPLLASIKSEKTFFKCNITEKSFDEQVLLLTWTGNGLHAVFPFPVGPTVRYIHNNALKTQNCRHKKKYHILCACLYSKSLLLHPLPGWSESFWVFSTFSSLPFPPASLTLPDFPNCPLMTDV